MTKVVGFSTTIEGNAQFFKKLRPFSAVQYAQRADYHDIDQVRSAWQSNAKHDTKSLLAMQSETNCG